MLYLDYEFNQVNSPVVNLVCCTTLWIHKEIKEVKEWWLHNDPLVQAELADYISEKTAFDLIFGYSLIAEARSFMALGLNPTNYDWIDGFLEYRCLTNHNDELLWGEQLVDGKVKTTRKPPPKWERSEEDSQNSFKPTHSLAEATFKLTGKQRDTAHKDKMRDLIISDPESFTPQERADIQAYCTEDVVFLPEIFEKIKEHYALLGFPYNAELEKEMLLRGKYAALTAKMESVGYPIDFEKTKNFSSSVAPILEECQREINALFPDIYPFKYNKKERRFSWDQKATKDWLKNNADIERWMKTDGFKKAKKDAIAKASAELLARGTKRKLTAIEKAQAVESIDQSNYLSLSGEAWQKQFDFKHDYPKDNFGAQMVRYLKLKQNLNGFVPNSRGSFWDAVGPDQRVRPWFNPYGSLSSRSQPGSRSFLFLKPAWMRALCIAPEGKAICGVDYGSQEYLISAIISCMDDGGDPNKNAMIQSYFSSDVYMAFAIASGMAPKGATKDTHKAIRQLAKAAVLGMSYLMTCIGLSAKLTADTGKLVTEEEAQDLIDAFYEVYYELGKWQERIQVQYQKEKHLKLPCGWAMFGDNDNFRSAVNFNIQGLGASIMRKAVEFCDEAGLTVIITLHDALYIEYDQEDYGAIDTLMDCMRRAFQFYFPEEMQEVAGKIKMDPFAWSRNYASPIVTVDANGKKHEKFSTITTPNGLEVDVADVYIDERSKSEYEQFSKYFDDRAENYL